MNSDFVTNVVKFNAQTNGRDKLCRLFQYACRLAYGRLQVGDYKDVIQTLKNIEYMFSMTRKLLRFGKSLDFIQGALKSVHLKDQVLRLTITLSKINQAFYLLFDHFLWFNNVGAVKLDKQYWSEVSSKFYLATLMLNLMRDTYGIWCVVVEELNSQSTIAKRSSFQNEDSNSNYKHSSRRQKSVSEIARENSPLILDTVKNLFDLSIPMSTLGFVKLSASKQGLLGCISSLAALLTVWNPTYKLVPS